MADSKGTSQRVRQSMLSMLAGRPLSALAGLMVLVLLSRNLPAREYGVYFALWALAEIAMLVSNLGLQDAVYRYISAEERLDGSVLPRGPVWRLLGWRCLTLLAAATAFALVPPLSASFSVSAAQFARNAAPLLGLLVLSEGLARYIETIFEAMLCQSRSQCTVVGRTLLRLLGVAWLLSGGTVHFEQMLWLELAASSASALVALTLLLDTFRRARGIAAAPAHANAHAAGFGRITRFALPGYIAQLLGQVYSADALKLVLAGGGGAAVFGFAYSLASVVQRYMPVHLLGGVLRPVFVQASRKPDADALLSTLLGMVVKINWLLILPLFCFVYFGGSPLLSMLSGGNYPEAGPVVTVLVLAMLGLAAHMTLSMYCLAREISWPVLLATATSTVGLPIGIYMAHRAGAFGVAIAYAMTEVIWCSVCTLVLLRHARGGLRIDWRGIGKLPASAALALLACAGLQALAIDWMVLAPLSALLFIGIAALSAPFSAREKGWLCSILPIDRLPGLRRSS